ncbi:hypothetical protein FBU59_000110 [Linderina macrospora]|uniref:Uncharacterized protein n=1 Tax=Linderina macrospora TaxID=4868 RepID=A0ACC1JI04_9FUNG|nr:hypothetical protein FBU59_000110 [Linderina macrospora]
MQSHGHSQRRGPCPPPISAIICRSGVNLQSVWQWLSLHRGRLAYLVNEQFIRNTIAVTRPPLRDSDLNRTFDESVPTNTSRYVLYDEFNTRQARNLHGPLPRRHPSHESVDSTLPAYEPPPPSIHSSIPEDIRAEIEEIQRLQAEVAANGGGDHGFVSSSSELQSNESDSDTDEEHESTYLRIVPQAAAVAPPQYWDVADDTEYGRLHTVQDTVIDAYMDSAVTESTASDSLERPSTQSVQETTSQQQSAPTFTRTFTRSMPMLTSILDEGDEIEASIAQYRQRIIADSNNSAMVEPPSPPSPLPPLPAIVDSPPVPSASRTHVMRPTASHGTSLFGGINQHMRRSRLSAKTNPEYGKRSWFSRLLNM